MSLMPRMTRARNLEKRPPVVLRLALLHTAADDGSPTLRRQADVHGDGTRLNGPAAGNLFLSGIDANSISTARDEPVQEKKIQSRDMTQQTRQLSKQAQGT